MPRVLTIPPSARFLPVLAQAFLDGTLVPGFAPGANPLALASATVFLPTRRAGRMFADALLEAAGTTAILLPKIVPLGDVDEDALAFLEDAPVLAAPHAITSVHRRVVLARLVAAWRDALREGEGRAAVAAGPAATLALADELSHLFDDLTTAGVPIERLNTLVPQDLDPYFQISLEFLRIARTAFSGFLDEEGLVEPAVRRDRLMDAEGQRLAALGRQLGQGMGPVIAAGSTGSMPATARLLRVISRLPNGAVVLPGLDMVMEDAAFALITEKATSAPDHPQYGMARLLNTLEVPRADVVSLAMPAAHGREQLISEVMRQAETSDLWASLPERMPVEALSASMARVSVVEADDPRQEALAIALLLRETLERADETVALVTPDRDLARRVAAELARFSVRVDDSSGAPLGETQPGRLARLAVQVAAEHCAPVPLFALLSMPLASFGLEPREKALALSSLELIALRGPRPRGGIGGLRAALDAFEREKLRGSDPRRRVDGAGLAAARDLVERLGAALGGLLDLGQRHMAVPLSDLVAAHRTALEVMMGELDPQAEDAALATLASTFRAVEAAAQDGPEFSLTDYADVAGLLIADSVVRPETSPGVSRVRILGPLESRMVHLDRIVLGGLVEGVWPQQGESDPWLSRPMRAELGLALPERRVGLSAHDFAQGFGAKEVMLSFAAKVGGAQSVPSRFLKRLETVAGPELWAAARTRGTRWKAAALALDAAPPVPRAQRPVPTPPLALRPRRLTVTEVETFLRDPYSIFARHVLCLQPLDPLDAAPGGAERGSALHEAVGNFARDFPKDLPPDAYEKLIAHGRKAFAPLTIFPAEHALWWARFERVAAFLVGFEQERRKNLHAVVAETSGQIDLPVGAEGFRLAGRADRIEIRTDGTLAILDFKTGTAPTARQAASLSPQLVLEAAMAKRGGFKDVPAADTSELAYVELKGGAQGGEEKPIAWKDREPMEVAEAALSGLMGLLWAFEDERQGYRALAAPQWRGRFGDYDHLARVREWALGGDEDE